ncbi:MAG: hypothetical protein WHV64_07080 [Geminicoccaceae bacterium]
MPSRGRRAAIGIGPTSEEGSTHVQEDQPAGERSCDGPRLVVEISGHGFGHAGQLAPILAELRRRRPGLRPILRSSLPHEALEAILGGPFDRGEPAPDPCLLMHDPVRVDLEATRRAYAELEANWDALVEREAVRLRALAPDLLVANIGFLPLAAAAVAGIPAVAICSLDWADIAEAYGVASPAMIERMRAAYRRAALTLLLTPHLPMPWLERRVTVGPVARVGKPRRAELRATLGLARDAFLGLVAFGGIAGAEGLAELPRLDGVIWLVDRLERPDMLSTRGLGFAFPDLLASVDLLVTKTGYGLFAEAAAAGTPLLYRPRPDWPEAPGLEGWIREVGIGRPLPNDPEGIAAAVAAVRAAPRPLPVPPTGVAEAVAILERRL